MLVLAMLTPMVCRMIFFGLFPRRRRAGPYSRAGRRIAPGSWCILFISYLLKIWFDGCACKSGWNGRGPRRSGRLGGLHIAPGSRAGFRPRGGSFLPVGHHAQDEQDDRQAAENGEHGVIGAHLVVGEIEQGGSPECCQWCGTRRNSLGEFEYSLKPNTSRMNTGSTVNRIMPTPIARPITGPREAALGRDDQQRGDGEQIVAHAQGGATARPSGPSPSPAAAKTPPTRC